MTTIEPRVRAALGLGEDATLDRQGRFVAPRSPEGRGLAAASPLDAVVDAFLKAPHAAELVQDDAPGALRRWTREPGIFLLETTGLSVRQSGGQRSALSDEELAVDARAGDCFVRLTGPALDVVWHLSADAAELLEVRTSHREAPTSSAALLSKLADPVEVELTLPPIDTITGGGAPLPWLKDAHAGLAASPSLVDRAASVGHLVRFHTPERTHGPIEELLALPSPSRNARAWCAGLPRATRDALVMLAVSRVATLDESFEEVREALASEAPEARDLARAWVAERDVLESVEVLFGDDAPVLREALAALDTRVAMHHSLWDLVHAWEDDPLLCEVSWREPDAWWGRLCGS